MVKGASKVLLEIHMVLPSSSKLEYPKQCEKTQTESIIRAELKANCRNKQRTLVAHSLSPNFLLLCCLALRNWQESHGNSVRGKKKVNLGREKERGWT